MGAFLRIQRAETVVTESGEPTVAWNQGGDFNVPLNGQPRPCTTGDATRVDVVSIDPSDDLSHCGGLSVRFLV